MKDECAYVDQMFYLQKKNEESKTETISQHRCDLFDLISKCKKFLFQL